MVDDEPSVRETVTMSLMSAGYDVAAAEVCWRFAQWLQTLYPAVLSPEERGNIVSSIIR